MNSIPEGANFNAIDDADVEYIVAEIKKAILQILNDQPRNRHPW